MKTLRMYFTKRSDMLCFLYTMLGYCSSGTILRNVNFTVNYECYGNNEIFSPTLTLNVHVKNSLAHLTR